LRLYNFQPIHREHDGLKIREFDSALRTDMAMKKSIPEATVRRLSAYLRKLEDLAENDVAQVSSRELAEHIKVGPEMTRRDLGMFGQFGNRGKGYGVESLRSKIRGILGTKQEWDVALVGVGWAARSSDTRCLPGEASSLSQHSTTTRKRSAPGWPKSRSTPWTR
jgi:hypothetical protein